MADPKTHFKSMEEFAIVCGVSRPTLSKYFSDPKRVKEVTRKQIEAALKKYKFEPNMFARHLNTKRSRNIGILVPTIADPFYAQMVSLLELALRARGCWPIQITTHARPDLEDEAVRTLLAFKAVGVVAAPLWAGANSPALARLNDAMPVVYFDSSPNDRLSSAGNDNSQSMAAMVRYLCRSGEPPFFIDNPQPSRNAEERRDSFRSAMIKEGHDPLIVCGATTDSWEFERLGFEIMQDILARNALPGKTVLCANDRMAFGVMAAAGEAGLIVGRDSHADIRVAGHDDHPLSRYANPSLTTMAQNADEIAARSVDLLLSHVKDAAAGNHAEPTAIVLEATIVMRDSA